MSAAAATSPSSRYDLSAELAAIFERGPSAQPFRTLATEILVQHVDKGRRALAICAATAGTGASFVTATLGVALSQVGVETAIVDANLRAPSLDRFILPDPAPSAGLLQFLRDPDVALEDILCSHALPDLSLIYAGGVDPKPQDLFDTERFKQAIRACMRGHQLTLVDTPPASRSAEARRIAAVAGYAIIVGRRDLTFTEDLGVMHRELTDAGVTVIGSVFNDE